MPAPYDDWRDHPAERKLAEDVDKGLTVKIGDGTLPPENLPDTDPRVIRTSFLRALILGRIEGHPPHAKGVLVQGAYLCGDGKKNADSVALDLDGCEIKFDLDLKHCRITVPIRLNMTRMVSLRLVGSRINAGIEAKGLIASGGLLLMKAYVCRTLDLLGASVAGSLDACLAKFDGYDAGDRGHLDAGVPRIIDGRGLKVGGGLRLPRATVDGVVDLTGADLRGDLRLNSLVQRPPSSNCYGAILDRIRVSGNLQLDGVAIPGGLACRHSRINGDFRIDGGDFGKTDNAKTALDLHGTEIKQCLHLKNNVKVNGKLDLGSMRVELFDDARCSWPAAGGLILDRISIAGFAADGTDARLRSAWLNRMSDDPFTPQPWEECARVLREMGHGAAARDILIEKEKRQRAARRARLLREGRHLAANWHAIWDAVLGGTVRYGRVPLLAAAWLFLLVWVGAAIFGAAFARDQMKPNLPQIQRAPEWVLCGVAEGETVRLAGREAPAAGLRAREQSRIACFHDQPEGASHPRFSALPYSADALVPVVSLEMQSYWIPDDEKPFGAFARFYLWLHIAAGWFLTLLAVAGFSGLIRTDNTK